MYISIKKELPGTKMAESNEIIMSKHQVNDEHEHSNAASEEEVIAKNYF